MTRFNQCSNGGLHPGTRLWFVAAILMTVLGAAALPGITLAQEKGPKLAPVQLSPERRQLIGLRISTVREMDLTGRIDTTGLVEPDEQLEGYVQTRFSGWIRQVYVNQTYQLVRKGQPLFTIYSPDLVSSENEYLIALGSEGRLDKSSVEGVAAGAQALLSGARDRLRQFGVPEHEIRRLEREKTAQDSVEIDSPMSGYVVERNALPNMYVQPDTRLYAITTLSNVWVYAAVFQNQIGQVRVGDPVSMTVDTYPGKKFAGRVDFIWAAIDPATRTAKVRCSFSNPQALLKIGMYVGVSIAPHLGRGLVIPDTGVLRTGEHNVVFIDSGDGYLRPTEVELGPHLSHAFQVLKGLHAGDRIVSSANFLIDSESQLQAAVGAFVPPPPGAGAAELQPQTATANIQMTTEPSPPARGRNQLHVSLTDQSGKPISGAEVSITFYMPAMPAMGMAAMRAQATASDQGNGHYLAEIELQSGGTWQVTITARRGGRPLANRQFDLSASGSMAM